MATIYKLINDDVTEIKYIYHLSDIHIRGDKRKQEYIEIFERTEMKLKSMICGNEDISLIIVTGDIMHHKTVLIADAYDIMNYFFSILLNITSVIIIAGNHDCNTSNINKTDALSPAIRNNSYEKYNINDKEYEPVLIKKKKNNKLYYLRKSGFYRYHNIIFGVTNILDNIFISANKFDEIQFKNIKQKNKYLIALYHGTINGSKINNSYKITNVKHRLNVGDFDGYDYVMLGDIHKYQFLNKEKTIAYAGSLIQQSFGETIENHGILKWDLLENKKQFIEIPNDYGYCTINIIDGKMKETFIPIKPRIRFILQNTDKVDYLKIRNQILNKYQVEDIPNEASINLSILNKMINDCFKIEDIKNKDLMYIDKIRSYLENKKLTSDDINDIIKLHKTIYNKIISEKDYYVPNDQKSGRYWEILELRFSNVLSYGENNIIDFSQYEKNQIIGIVAPNYYGKSAIIDIILYCLFDKWSREPNTNKGIMNENKNNLYCSLKFKIGKKIYLIERTARRPKKGIEIRSKSKFSLIKVDSNGNEIKEELTEALAKDTNKLIRELIGDYDDYLISSICLQEDIYNFISLTPKKKIQFLQKILHIDIFNDCHKIAYKKSKELEKECKKLSKQLNKYDIDTINKNMKEKLSEIEILEHKKKDFIQSLKLIEPSSIPTLIKYDELNEYKLNTENDILDKINELQNNLDNINKYDIQDVIKIFDNLNSKINILDNKLEKLIHKRLNLSKNILKLPDDINNKSVESELENKSIILNKIINIEKFLSDFNKLSNEDISLKINRIEIKIIKLKKNIIHLDSDMNELLETLQDIDEQIYKNEQIIFNSSEIYLNNLYNIKNKHFLSNSMKIKNYHYQYIQNINNKLELCLNEDMSNYAKEILSSIISDNQHLINKYTIWKESIDNSLSSIHDIPDIYKLMKKNIHLKRVRFETILNFFTLIDNENIQKQINILEKKLKTFANILKKRDELIILNDQLLIVNNNINQLEYCESNKILIKKISDIDKKIKDIEFDKNVSQKQLIKYKTKIDIYNDNLHIKQRIQHHIVLLNKYHLEFINWNCQLNNYNNSNEQIEKIKLEISDIDKCCNNYNYEYAILKKDFDMYNDLLNSYHKKCKNSNLYNIYSKMVNNKGLPALIVKNFLPIINSHINHILLSFVDYTAELILVDNHDKKEKNKKYEGDIKINICHKDIKKYYINKASGSEKFNFRIALRITLSYISMCPKPNFFIIDEGFSCLDTESKNNINILFDYIKQLYDHVIIISHSDELKNQYDYNINIDKVNGHSHVTNIFNLLNNST